MLPIRVKEIEKAVQGKLISGDLEKGIYLVSTDSRNIKEGSLFIPLIGENFDGHDFIAHAVKKGANGFLTSKDISALNIDNGKIKDKVAIKVDNTLTALHDLAIANRIRLKLISIGITGSTGKTCTKDIIKSILSLKYKTIVTKKNYNNEIGVPLTVLDADEKTEVLVAELAMRGKGQIASLAEITKPDLGVITNVGLTHFELMGSVERIAEAKAELVKALPEDGTLFLNLNDSWSNYLSQKTKAEKVFFGLGENAQVRAHSINLDLNGCPTFRLIVEGDSGQVNLKISGRHNVINSLAASAVSWMLGLNIKEIIAGLEKAELTPLRMDIKKTPSGVLVINDTYNANPTSMEAALQALVEIHPNRRKIAVLGDMAELGDISKSSHNEIGQQVAELDINYLITVGEMGREIYEGANTNGQKEITSQHFSSKKEAYNSLKSFLKEGDVVLVKASRSMEMEKIVNWLIKEE